MRSQQIRTLKIALAAGTAMIALPTLAAEVTPQRLANPEPKNWLMNHRSYDGQRFSPLTRINRDNVKGLRLAYAVPLGGSAGNEFSEATPLADDGFLYVASRNTKEILRYDAKDGRPSSKPFIKNLADNPEFLMLVG